MAGPRRLDVLHDLPALARLLHLAFGQELRLTGASLAEDLVLARVTAPLMWLLGFLSPRARDHFLGFVWEEDGQMVGNASLSHLDPSGKRWMIGNVAVHPAYRRRGIARRLTREALKYCRSQGAEVVSLEVRRDNTAAYSLYLSLGFCLADTAARLCLEGSPQPGQPPSPNYSLHRLTWGEWNRPRALLRLVEPPTVAGLQVARRFAFRPSLLGWLRTAVADLAAGRRRRRWVLERQGLVVAYLEVTIPSGPDRHNLYLAVHPEFRGAVEESLVALILPLLPTLSRPRARLDIPSAHASLLAALRRRGFREEEVLDTLVIGAGRPRGVLA